MTYTNCHACWSSFGLWYLQMMMFLAHENWNDIKLISRPGSNSLAGEETGDHSDLRRWYSVLNLVFTAKSTARLKCRGSALQDKIMMFDHNNGDENQQLTNWSSSKIDDFPEYDEIFSCILNLLKFNQNLYTPVPNSSKYPSFVCFGAYHITKSNRILYKHPSPLSLNKKIDSVRRYALKVRSWLVPNCLPSARAALHISQSVSNLFLWEI